MSVQMSLAYDSSIYHFPLYIGVKTICIINYVTYPTLYHNMGFVLDNFAQL